jgi:hypothetical integral membrane protein (TIGR02206 family)
MTSTSLSPPFILHSPAHSAALLITLLLSFAMVWLSRRRPITARPLQQGLAVLLLLQWPLNLAALAWSADLSLQNGLPLHLCDLAAVSAALALLWQRPLAAEFAYFFGLAGTAQGLLTPNLAFTYPHPRYLTFFITHSSVVIAAIVIVIGMGQRPRPWAVLRMVGWLAVYAMLVGGLNLLLGTNYGFLCAKPNTPSALDLMGPWPYYIASIAGVAGVAFTLLDAPFAWQRRRGRLTPEPGK